MCDGLCCFIAGCVAAFLDSLKLPWIPPEVDGAIDNGFPWWPVEYVATASLLPPGWAPPSFSAAAAALRAAMIDNSRIR